MKILSESDYKFQTMPETVEQRSLLLEAKETALDNLAKFGDKNSFEPSEHYRQRIQETSIALQSTEAELSQLFAAELDAHIKNFEFSDSPEVDRVRLKILGNEMWQKYDLQPPSPEAIPEFVEHMLQVKEDGMNLLDFDPVEAKEEYEAFSVEFVKGGYEAAVQDAEYSNEYKRRTAAQLQGEIVDSYRGSAGDLDALDPKTYVEWLEFAEEGYQNWLDKTSQADLDLLYYDAEIDVKFEQASNREFRNSTYPQLDDFVVALINNDFSPVTGDSDYSRRVAVELATANNPDAVKILFDRAMDCLNIDNAPDHFIEAKAIGMAIADNLEVEVNSDRQITDAFTLDEEWDFYDSSSEFTPQQRQDLAAALGVNDTYVRLAGKADKLIAGTVDQAGAIFLDNQASKMSEAWGLGADTEEFTSGDRILVATPREDEYSPTEAQQLFEQNYRPQLDRAMEAGARIYLATYSSLDRQVAAYLEANKYKIKDSGKGYLQAWNATPVLASSALKVSEKPQFDFKEIFADLVPQNKRELQQQQVLRLVPTLVKTLNKLRKHSFSHQDYRVSYDRSLSNLKVVAPNGHILLDATRDSKSGIYLTNSDAVTLTDATIEMFQAKLTAVECQGPLQIKSDRAILNNIFERDLNQQVTVEPLTSARSTGDLQL